MAYGTNLAQTFGKACKNSYFITSLIALKGCKKRERVCNRDHMQLGSLRDSPSDPRQRKSDSYVNRQLLALHFLLLSATRWKRKRPKGQ